MHGPPTHAQRPDHPRRSRSNEKRRTRPPPHWFTLGSFRTLAKRVAHPPPPVKEERYFMFVAPRYDVKLEDVIEGKRLPPLSLQDFEDYLTHVEGTSQNLHFYLWIKHYRHLHQLWASSVLPTFNIPSSSTGVYRSRDLWERLYPCQDRVLRDEFNYAKHNFFIKDAPMRLNICYELRRRVTMISNGPPMDGQEFTNKLPSFPNQPDPALFDPILAHITVQLREAFDRFLRIAFCNSGLWHACLGHLLGITILVPGLSLWCMGVGLAGNSGRRGRGFVAASLPLIWVGVWFMLVTVLGHCLGVWATGDARQLYPYETTRPLPPETSAPPVYSLARPPEPPPPAYSLSLLSARKLSAGSGISTSRVKAYLNAGKRGSDGVLSLRMFGRGKEGETDEEDGAMELNARASLDQRRRSEGALKTLVRDEKGEEVEVDARRTMERAAEMELQLPPARRTKDLSRQSFGIDALPAHPNLAPSSLAPRDTSTDVETGWKTTTDLGECVFTEADDFGIVVSEAYEEDEPYPLSPLPHAASSNHPNSTMEARSASTSPTETPHSVVPFSEHSTPRKSTIPEITLTPPPTASKLKPSHALEWVMSQATPVRPRKEGLVSPRWRNLLGPMTLVHDPLVRRAHWALTVRCWAVAGVVTCGMALGFIR